MDRKEIELEKSASRGVFSRLLAYAKPYILWMAAALFLVLVITVLELYRPVIMGEVIDLFMEDAPFSKVRRCGLIYLGVLLLGFVCNFLQTWILQMTGDRKSTL